MSVEDPDGVRLETLEGAAYHLGILGAFRILETTCVDDEEAAKDLNWKQLRGALLKLATMLGTNEFLQGIGRREKLFEQSIEQRAETDSRCFATTYAQLLAIRRSRGVHIVDLEPQGDTAGSPGDNGKTHYSSLDNYNRLCGMFEVLDLFEQSVSLGGLPLQTHYTVVKLLLTDQGIYRATNFFLEELQCREEVVKADAATLVIPAKAEEPLRTMLGLLDQARTDQKVFKELRSRFLRGHAEMVKKLGWAFVEDFLENFTAREPGFQVQQILYTLQNRLIARRQAVEGFEYDRLETIDKNVEHLLTTLKQYGIEARNFDEALKGYERQFKKETEPPKDKQAEIRSRVQSRIGDAIRLQEDRDAAVRDNPEFKQFIVWEYQKELGKLGGKG